MKSLGNPPKALHVYLHITTILNFPYRATGARNGSALSRSSSAAALVLQLLHSTPKPPEKPLSKKERNNLIRTRYAAGETLESLAREFSITVQRVHQMVYYRHH